MLASVPPYPAARRVEPFTIVEPAAAWEVTPATSTAAPSVRRLPVRQKTPLEQLFEMPVTPLEGVLLLFGGSVYEQLFGNAGVSWTA